MLGPYDMLHRGHAESAMSLAINFDKSPPHFQQLRSLRAGHLTLAALTTSVMLANILAVALASLFSPSTVRLSISMDVETFGTPVVRKTYSEPAITMYYTLDRNLSTEGDATIWTTPEYYIIPFYPIPQRSLQAYTGPTVGFSTDIKCDLVPDDMLSFSCNDTSRGCSLVDEKTYNPNLTVSDACFWDARPILLNHPATNLWVYWNRGDDCRFTFFPAWVEQAGDPHPPNLDKPYKTDLSGIALKCVARDIAYSMTATISPTYQVLSVTDVRPLDMSELLGMYPGSNSTTYGNVTLAFRNAVELGAFTELGESENYHWFNHLMTTLHPSIIRSITNVTNIPDSTDLARAFEDVFKRLFAINLSLYAHDIFTPGKRYVASGSAIVD